MASSDSSPCRPATGFRAGNCSERQRLSHTCTVGKMPVCKTVGMLMGFIGIISVLMALITDYWLVAYGPSEVAHSGLWQVCIAGICRTPSVTKGYITATRVFLILASLTAFASVLSLVTSFMPSACGFRNRPFVACIAAFTAGLCTLIAVAVFTAESWKNNEDSQVQLIFQWSFYLGWAAFPVLLLAGTFSLLAHRRSPRVGYESV